ncbi:unnamed protein product [Polarella glacialis]|uniref:Uncharacterized protein n=2 Tax=Polarella glacialis TaxID=89957 RepID=A0A813JIS7_POLGL|nr:unnamed protein product [Polarella glacialis]
MALQPLAAVKRQPRSSPRQASARDVTAGLATPLAMGLVAGRRRRRGRPHRTPAVAGTAEERIAVDASLRRLDERLERAMEAEIADGDKEAMARAEAEAQALFEGELQGRLSGFGSAEQLAKREYTLAELQEQGVEAARLLSPADSTFETVRRSLLAATSLGGGAFIVAFHPDPMDVVRLAIGGFFAITVDRVVNKGLLELLVVDSISRAVNEEYRSRVVQHEAGHFLVAYLLGLLPKAYTLSSWEALVRFKSPNVQAGCVFCDAAFQRESATGSISGRSLDRFICVALAGASIEYVLFGEARGGSSDIQQIETLLQACGFDQRRASAQVRWAALNTVSILKRHRDVHRSLARVMERGASVGECIAEIERGLAQGAAAVA